MNSINEEKSYRIYTKNDQGKKFYITASEGQYDNSKLILKSFENNENRDVNSIFKFKRSNKDKDNYESPDSEYFLISTVDDFNWTIGINRGTSTISYNKQKIIIFPDISKFIPDFTPDEDPEEEEIEEEEKEIEEEEIQIENTINTSAIMTEQYVQAIQTLFGNKTYKQFHDFAQILGFEKKVTKSIKTKLAFGSVSYANKDGGPNLYIDKKDHIVPDKSVLYNFAIKPGPGGTVIIQCWNYESGDVNVINAEDIGEFSNILINRHNNVVTPFYLEETVIPDFKPPFSPGFYTIKNKEGYYLSSDQVKGSEIIFKNKTELELTDNEIFEIGYHYNKIFLKTKNGLYLTFIKWKDIPKEGCFKHMKDTEVGWKRWIINTFNPFDEKYERMNFYPSGPDDEYVWCNSNKKIRDHLDVYGTPSLFLNDTFEDSILGKNSTFEIIETQSNNKLKLAPTYWQKYSLRKNPFGENMIIRMCDIDPLEFNPRTTPTFFIGITSQDTKKKINWVYMFLLILALILLLFTIFIILRKLKQ